MQKKINLTEAIEFFENQLFDLELKKQTVEMDQEQVRTTIEALKRFSPNGTEKVLENHIKLRWAEPTKKSKPKRKYTKRANKVL